MKTDLTNLADLRALLRRRQKLILIPWALLSLIALIVAFSLPRAYKSTAIMVMQTPMPTELTDTPVHFFADEQIQTIYHRVLTTENVLSIIDAHKLYGDSRDHSTKYDLVDTFKEDTDVELATSSLADSHSKLADIVFNLSFSYEEPEQAQKVASKLASLLIEQNDKVRTKRAAKVTDFLLDELGKLGLKSQDIDSKIAKYKEQNIFSLPEQAQGNLVAIDRIENELRDTDNLIRATKDKITYLRVELGRVQTELPTALNDNTPKSKEEALRMMQAKYAQLSSIYSPSHPDLIRAKRSLQALGSAIDRPTSKKTAHKRKTDSEQEFLELDGTYTGKHPELAKRKTPVSDTNQRLKKLSPSSYDDLPSPSSSPAYVGLQVQYKESQSELQSLIQKQDFLKTKMEKTQNNLTLSPQVEMEYSELIRQRDSTTKKYIQLKEKWLDAKLVQTMEEQQQGQTLTIIEPPLVPTHPEKAVRRKIGIGGIFGGLILGIGLAFLAEFLDPGIRGYRSLVATTGFKPIVVIPYIESNSETAVKQARQRQSFKTKFWTTSACVVFAIVALSYFFMATNTAQVFY